MNGYKLAILGTISLVISGLSAGRIVPPRINEYEPTPFAPEAITVPVPYSNDFESDITGWTMDNERDPTCIHLPPLSYCSNIQWNWVNNPELIQVAPDIFPDHVDYPEEVIDGITVAYLPEAHSGTRAWWCGSMINGTFVGDPYDPDLTVPLMEDSAYGNSYCWMKAWLITPVFNTAGLSNVYMSFWTWWEVECIDIYSFDVMEISVSIDGGAWTPIDTLNPPFSRLTGWNENDSYSSGGYLQYGQWVLWTYDLSAYAGHDIQIKFNFDTVDQLYNAFRGWLIDDFYIGGGPEHGELDWILDAPLAISAVDCRFDPNPFTADFSVWNSGGTMVHSVTATIILPPGLHLAGGDSIVNLGDIAPAETMFTSWQIYADDSLVGNRCFEVLLTSADSVQGFRDNFDDDTLRLFVGEPTGNFDYTDVSTVAPRASSPPSGTGIAGIPASGGMYPEAGDWSLTTTAPFDLTGFTECYIHFWHWLDARESGVSMEGIDGGILEINVNGTGWQQVDEFATGMLSPRYSGYIRNGISNPLAYKLTYCNDTGGWIQVQSLDLISLGYCAPGDLLEVRFRFGTGAFLPDPSTSNGWYIDDFFVSSIDDPIGPYNITHCLVFPLVDPPSVDILGDTIILCSGDTVELNSTVISGTAPYEYNWIPEIGLSSPHTANTFAYPETTSTYYLSVLDYFGCADTDTVVIIVDELFVSVGGDSSICFGDTAYVSANISDGVEPYSVNWNPSETVISPDSANTGIIGDTSRWYICTVTDDNGCVAKDSMYIHILPMPSSFDLISPPDEDSLLLGAIELFWNNSSDAEIYYVIVNGETLTTTTDTSYIFTGAECGSTYIWSVIAENGCGNVLSSEWTFYIYPCEGPQVYIEEPLPNTWSACEDQNIIMTIIDAEGVDDASISLNVNGTDYHIDDPQLTFDGETLRFVPSPVWIDGEYIDVCLDSVCDVHYNCLESPVCWSFDIDLSTPHFWAEFPTGEIDSIPLYAGFHLQDTLSGLDSSSVIANIIFSGDTTSLSLDSGLVVSDDSIWFDLSGYDFAPGDTVQICVHAQDNPDYCDPNVLDTCWMFMIYPCDLEISACEDIVLCPGMEVSLGAEPPAWSGTPPYLYLWTTADGDTVSTSPNPTVSPESTTIYILRVEDDYGCVVFDTVMVSSEFERITTVELLYPSADTMLPPGTVTLIWHSLDGTEPIYYNVIIDGVEVASGITDTSHSFDVGCDETHRWTIVGYNSCSSSIPRCDSTGVVATIDSLNIYLADTVTNPWGYSASADPPFYTYPCEGPVAYIQRPIDNSWSSCIPETIVVRIEGDSIREETITIRVNGIEYTVDSAEVNWTDPYLEFIPDPSFSDGDTIDICLLSAEDMYGNPLTGDSLCWTFFVDISPPYISTAFPPDDTILFSEDIEIQFEIVDWLSAPDSNSIQIYVNGILFDSDDPCVEIIPGYCDGHCFLISIDSSCVEFSGCDTVEIRVVATDSTDYCDDNILDTSWTFSLDCEGPQADVIYIPPDVVSSCPEDSISIWLWDSLPGVDTSTITLQISTIGTIYWGDAGLHFHDDTLIFIPGSPFPDEGTITVRLLSAQDMLGNELADSLEWTFAMDRIPPIALDWSPACGDSIPDRSPEISIQPYDSGCGITMDSSRLTINDTLSYSYIDGEIEIIAGRLVFDPDDFGISFSGGDEVEICWHLTDCADDICPANSVDTCCTFYVSAGGPVSEIRYPDDFVWSACDSDSILIFIEDENGIITSSISFELCTGGDCSDCETYTIFDTEISGLVEWADSLQFWFVPEPPLANDDTVCIHILTAQDSLGNTIEDGIADSMIFYMDNSSPVIWNEYPTGELLIIPDSIGFRLEDSLSGLDIGSVELTIIIDGDTTILTYSTEDDSFWASLADIEFTPAETIWVCVNAEDLPDLCAPNVLDTCWFFITPPCRLEIDACEDIVLCYGNSVQLGAEPPAYGGIEPYTYLWITAHNDTIDTIPNPIVWPESTTTYILIISDDYGCVEYDTITVYSEFEPVTDGELISPLADEVLPPGMVTLIWHTTDGTPPIYYDVYVDGEMVAPGITDTSYSFDVPCGQTHYWSVSAYNYCSDTIPHCVAESVWIEIDSGNVYIIDTLDNPWGWEGDPPFHTQPCDGPDISIEHPFDNAYSACYPESIVITIIDPDGLVDSTIVVSVNGIEYTVDSSQIVWSEPTLTFHPDDGFADGAVIDICVLSAGDIYGNPASSTPCIQFYIDRSPPGIDILEPDTSSMVIDYEQDIVIQSTDIASGIDQASIGFTVNGIDQTSNLVHTGDESYLVSRFIPENVFGQFAPGETVSVTFEVCDLPDFCGPNCSQLEFQFITVPKAACYIRPNPFTPDGNNINDFVVFDYPAMFARTAELIIFDGRGIEVYREEIGPISDAAELEQRKWNGLDNEGNPLPNGIYIYIIVQEGEVVCSGTVILVR
ncbi:hypothetical protein DRQ33_00870 [bacterium]|nr:MAG: hypothetical protein DRQ33_00870 [bacterium]